MSAFVYAVFANGRPTYIGCTNNAQRRLREHRWWMSRINVTHVEVTEYADRRAAADAEGRLIRLLLPSRNLQGLPLVAASP